MTNTQEDVKGYRKLSAEEIALMNRIKEQGEILGALVEDLTKTAGVDTSWVYRGKDNLQIGIMQLVRGVAKPTTF